MFRHLLLAVCLMGLPLSQPQAASTDLERLLIDESFAGPGGFLALCQRSENFCESHPRSTKLLLDRQLIELLDGVNRRVNAAIDPIVEPVGTDNWRLAPLAGDCEDYVLTKRKWLLDAGLAPGDMRIAVLFTETGEYHAALIVETSGASMVLDNRFDNVRYVPELSELGYRWIAAQEIGNPRKWRLTQQGLQVARALNRKTAPLVTAAD